MIFLSITAALAAISSATAATPGISAPPDGMEIISGEAFNFRYNTIADYSVHSYGYDVWLVTQPQPGPFTVSKNIYNGHYFGRFATPNYPADPNPSNPAPAQLVMPEISLGPGGFGCDSGAEMYIMVVEDYSNGNCVSGNGTVYSFNRIVYKDSDIHNLRTEPHGSQQNFA